METKFELLKKAAIKVASQWGIDLVTIYANEYKLILEAELKGLYDDDRVSFQAIRRPGSKQFITEIRLAQQDIFICNEWGLFLLNTSGEEDITFEEHTYPDKDYFDKKSEEEAEIFYNGNLSLVVNNLIVVPGVRTDKFKVYRGVEKRREYGLSGLVGIEDGYWILIGSKNIYFHLQLPRKTNWMDSPIRLRLRLKGILFRNATITT
jgi:hypothetical protein